MLKVVHEIEVRKAHFEKLTLIPLAGEAEPQKFGISANSVVLRLSQVCDPDTMAYSLMTTPITGVEKAHVLEYRERQEESSGIKPVIEMARHVKFAFTGIGEAPSGDNALARLANHCGQGGHILEDAKDVVGDICYRPIDENGQQAWPELSDRLVGPELDDLHRMASKPDDRRVFAVACGHDKVKPIIAAFRGGLVNGLITDELTALEILEELRTRKEGLAKTASRAGRSKGQSARGRSASAEG